MIYTCTIKRVLIFLLITGLSFINYLSFAQDAFRSGDGWGGGWNNNAMMSATGFGNARGISYINTNGAGLRYFRLYTTSSNQEHGPSGSSDIQINIGSPTSLTNGNNKAYYINVANNSNNYVFRTPSPSGSPRLVVFEVQGAVGSVSSVTQNPTTPLACNATVITANTGFNFATGQSAYLRYSVDNFSSSTVIEMTNSGAGTYTATIPAQSVSTTVRYYVFTSGSGLTIPHADADWFTINGNTNRGSNYSYTVSSTCPVITPSTASISGLNTTSSQSFTVDGSGLTGDLTVTAPTNFEVSDNNTSFSSSVTITVVGGTPSGRVGDTKGILAPKTIYVRVSPSVPAGTPPSSVSGVVFISGGGATTQNINVSGSGPLPVTFTNFVAKQAGNRVALSWQTSFERDNEGFDIERSKNARDFNSLGFVKGNGDFVGKSEYSFTDETPLKGINYYRLKQKDFSGKFDYSRTISVVNLNEMAEEIIVSPNPSVDKIRFEYAESSDIEDISLFDTKGQKIKSFQKAIAETSVSDLPTGQYLIKLQMTDGRTITKKIVKQ